MKLIARDDVREGQIYRDDATIVFGRLLDYRGWYVLFNLKFVQKHTDKYIDPRTWELRAAQCYYRVRFTLRYRVTDSRWLFYKASAWDEVTKQG